MPVTAVRKSPFGLEPWVKKLGEMQVVALSGVISELNRLTSSDDSSVNQLAEVIMRDASLTSKIIRVANSAMYNPSRLPINTVTKAIVHVGFNTVRAICVSSVVMESLLEKHPRKGLVRQMAQSFHAAVQARNLCERFRPDLKEEVFVAALLLHLGKLLIWTSDYSVSDQAYELEMAGAPAAEIEALLGTTPERITREIANQWHLGDTLNQVLTLAESDFDRKAEAVWIGDLIASTADRGWDSPEMAEVLKRAAEFTERPEAETRKLLQQSLKEAHDLSAEYNDPRVTRLIEKTRNSSTRTAEDSPRDLLQADSAKQLAVLQELMKMMAEGIDSSRLFGLILKGLHEGVGLERVALLLLNPARTQVVGKFFLGEGTATWKGRFHFDYERSERNLFGLIMHQGKPVSLGGAASEAGLTRIVPASLGGITHTDCFLLAPLKAHKREVGFLYADMGLSDRPVTAELDKGFRHFVQQTGLCLSLLANRK